jgi:hypothetical protein
MTETQTVEPTAEPKETYDYLPTSVFEKMGIEKNAPAVVKQAIAVVPAGFARMNGGESTADVLRDLRDVYSKAKTENVYDEGKFNMVAAMARETTKEFSYITEGHKSMIDISNLLLYHAASVKSETVGSWLATAARGVDQLSAHI